MGAANGLMYTVRVSSVNVTNVAQNLWEIIAASGVSLLIHSIRIELLPSIISGIAQDVRAALAFQRITSTGTGGTAVGPLAEHPRNTVGSPTTCNSLVTSPGTVGSVLSAFEWSILTPFERVFTADQRIQISGGGRFAVALTGALGAVYTLSSEIYFEEF